MKAPARPAAAKSKPRPAKPLVKAKPAATTKANAKARAKLSAAEVEEIFKRFEHGRPDPKGELESVNVFTLLVAVVLSAQATDAGVNKATRALFAVADTPAKMAALGEDKVRDYIKTIGLFRNKATNVIALSQKLVAEHGGEVPRNRDHLEALPGVGRKTANVVLNMAFGEPTWRSTRTCSGWRTGSASSRPRRRSTPSASCWRRSR